MRGLGHAIGLSTLASLAAPHIAEDDTVKVVAAIDARHGHVYLQVFGPAASITRAISGITASA